MIDNDVLTSLAAKIDAIDLDAAEQEALDLLFERAGSNAGEVEGFAFSVSSAGLSPSALRLAAGIGGLGLSARPERMSRPERRGLSER